MLRVAALWVPVVIALHVAVPGAWGHEAHRESFESEPEVAEPTPDAADAAPEAATSAPDLAPHDVEPPAEPPPESSKHAAPTGVPPLLAWMGRFHPPGLAVRGSAARLCDGISRGLAALRTRPLRVVTRPRGLGWKARIENSKT